MSTGRKPDWSLCVLDRDSKWATIGAAWNSEKGNISIRLNGGAEPPNWDTEKVMLFPYREKPQGWKRKPYGEQREAPKPASRPPAPAPESDDYMERKRRERQKPPQVPTTPPNPGADYDPDAHREPDWL